MEQLVLRARLLQETRRFFAQHGIMEVETPLLCATALPESHIEPIPALLTLPGEKTPTPRFLPASPEAHMKRLLAAGSGPIFQLARAFRNGEAGALHNPEFTMLEWYRPGFDLNAMMAETVALADRLTGCGPASRITFGAAFQRHAGLDPFSAPVAGLQECARRHGWEHPAAERDELLDFLLATLVEPAFRQQGGAILLTAYPASRAAMARIDPGPPPVALRFELYVNGVELANGYEELTDAAEQARRLELTNRQRATDGLAPLPVDHHFLAALEAGLPPCSGVAMGFDRMVMLAAGAQALHQVIAFPWERA